MVKTLTLILVLVGWTAFASVVTFVNVTFVGQHPCALLQPIVAGRPLPSLTPEEWAAYTRKRCGDWTDQLPGPVILWGAGYVAIALAYNGRSRQGA